MHAERLAHLRRVVQPGLDALRLLWLPFVLIQSAGLLLVLAYFHVPAVARACDLAGNAKARTGLLFAAITMPIACGVVPEIFKFITGVDRSFTRRRVSFTLHNMGLFCVGGIFIDLFYTWVGRAFVGVAPVPSVLGKVLLDQLLYTPIIGVPLIAISYTLRSESYRPLLAVRRLNGPWYAREVLPVLVTCWAYWFPMTSLMYTLPPRLTFVYGMVASAASATLLTAVAGRHEQKMADAHV